MVHYIHIYINLSLSLSLSLSFSLSIYMYIVFMCHYLFYLELLKAVHGGISLMSSSLVLQQCPTCLVRQILIVFEMGGRTATVLWDVASRICSIQLAALVKFCLPDVDTDFFDIVAAVRHISTRPVYHLSRLRASNVDRLN